MSLKQEEQAAGTSGPVDCGAGTESQGFRYVLLVLAVLLWAAALRLSIHQSRYPIVLRRYSGIYFLFLLSVTAIAGFVTAMQVPRLYAGIYRIRYHLLWIFVACPVIAILMAEGMMRMLNLLGSSLYDDIGRYSASFVYDKELGYGNPPNHHGTYQGVEVVTNSFGFRDRAITEKSPGSVRILVLGDSVTFGMGVPVDLTFSKQLEGLLRARGHSAEVINAGVIGYNTRQELASLERYGELLRPDVVALLYVDNDTDPDATPLSEPHAMPAPWREPGTAATYILSKSRIYAMLRHIGPVLLRGDGASFDRSSPGWRRSMESLSRMSFYCRARGIPFVAFHFRMLPNGKSDALNADLSKVAAQERFSFVDVLPWFANRNISLLTNSFVDSHPNAQGHRILAEGMSRFLLDTSEIGLK